MKTAVNNHNESVLHSKEEENNRRKCNSIIEREWPLKQNYFSNINSKIESAKIYGKTYAGSCKTAFKQRYVYHQISFASNDIKTTELPVEH